MNSNLLNSIYQKYNISNLQFGVIGDKLGDCYEEYLVTILTTTSYIECFNNDKPNNDIEYDIFKKILECFSIDNTSKIKNIDATSKIQSRITGGMPKTDIIADISFNNDTSVALPISVKQSTVKKVAFAEFDVETIIKEIGIDKKNNQDLIKLLNKHQTDASAKNFTINEKELLKESLSPYSKKFVQWVVTGSPKDSNDLRIPKCIVKFDINKKDYDLSNYYVYTISNYIDYIMLDTKGNPKKGGFGTGLSWTYATGSRGKKIQFKG